MNSNRDNLSVIIDDVLEIYKGDGRGGIGYDDLYSVIKRINNLYINGKIRDYDIRNIFSVAYKDEHEGLRAGRNIRYLLTTINSDRTSSIKSMLNIKKYNNTNVIRGILRYWHNNYPHDFLVVKKERDNIANNLSVEIALCGYCSGDYEVGDFGEKYYSKKKEGNLPESRIMITNGLAFIEVAGESSTSYVKIEYCPHCGRRL